MRGIALAAAALVVLAPAHLAAQPNDEADSEKKICKKSVETGSLVKAKKVCRTAREWQAEREAAREATKDLQNSRLAGPNG